MLTEEEIDLLFEFCKKHFVKYDDLKVELVDYLSKAVESKMKDSKLTFEMALQKAHEEFGPKGFATFVSKREEAAHNQSSRLFWNFFEEQLRWPKCIPFIFLFAILYTFLSFDPFLIKWFYYSITIGGLIMLSFYTIWVKIVMSKKRRHFVMLNFTWVFLLFILTPFLSSASRFFTDKSLFSGVFPNYLIMINCLFQTFYCVILVASWKTISSLKQSLLKSYPQFFG
ncbi:MAG TPA: hypothetical protein VN722_04560 [Hanamia sp.]|nr:hypothetical protein [Hanamia sp.]